MFKRLKQIFSNKFIPFKEFKNTDEQNFVHLSSFFINNKFIGGLK